MPLHGKVVVMKRSGGDGAEFPLTAACTIGRKPECDIRIQLPQVSKEHCRIDLNENKEVILTNLSSVNPTLVNGELLAQPERLKHGDVITIVDRSFRFEYPPAPTPKKKRTSRGGNSETFKVLQSQQIETPGDKRLSEVSAGANHDNVEQPLEKTMERETKEDDSLQNKTNSPFSDLYQMIKKSLDVKTPRKSSVSQLQTPSSRFCTPKPASLGENEAQTKSNGTPQSAKKKRRSSQVLPAVVAEPTVEQTEEAAKPEDTSSQVTEQTKSPVGRKSREGTPAKPVALQEQAEPLKRTSPRNLGKAEPVDKGSKKRKSGEVETDMPTPETKKKRVSFGGYLSPELFDRRLPPALPLRKGATPRRSLTLLKPKLSLLRRASAIGLLNDKSDIKTTAKTPSPKQSKVAKASPKTPTPGQKSPKLNSSPKAATPAKKSPKSTASSPKAATPLKKSPKSTSSPKAETAAKKSPKSTSSSPKGATPLKKSPKSQDQVSLSGRSPGKMEKKQLSLAATNLASEQDASSIHQTPATTPVKPGDQTPNLQGRFSVSRITTPPPDANVDHASEQVSSVTVTPKLPLKRKSISKKTPRGSVQKVMHIRGGISRASLKVSNRWADIVKFGKPKEEVVAATKATLVQKKTKKIVSKPQAKTPVRQPRGHVTTGHADSPATIVVGKAHKRAVLHPTGAAPRVITNIALRKTDMKMDEDLSGISEMFKTPQNKKRSGINPETPAGDQAVSVMGLSVLDTPEEPGEMVVSPLTFASTVKSREYNSEAVQRLLNEDEECSYATEISLLDVDSDVRDNQSTDSKVSTTTPKQKPEIPDCLTGVKRLMKTPRQKKSEPVEDLRGKLLKTPKQKPEPQECLTGVKRIMKTPRQKKSEPIEDLRGKLLKTPKQKPEPQECLTGVKRIMKTPKQKAEPVEDLRGKLLKTPKQQKPEQQECLTGVKRLMKTPKQKNEPVEDLRGKLLKTPKQQKPEQQECLSGIKNIFMTPQPDAEVSEDHQEKPMTTPEVPESSDLSSDVVQELLKTPEDSQDVPEVAMMETLSIPTSPGEGVSGIKRIIKTPKEKAAPVEDMVGLKRLWKSPREKGQPVEENFGLKRLMKSPRLKSNSPVEDFSGLQELMEEPLTESEEQLVTKELTSCHMVNSVSETEEPTTTECQESEVKQEIAVDVLSKEDEKKDNSDQLESLSGTVDENVVAVPKAVQKKAVRGKRTKQQEPKEEEDDQEAPEEVITAPLRARRGKKIEAAAPPAGRATRTRNTKSQENVSAVETKDSTEIPIDIPVDQTAETNTSEEKPVALDEDAVKKPRKGTRGKQTTVEAAESVPTEEVTDKQLPDAQPELPVPPTAAGKPRRGRKQTVEQNEVAETVVIVETSQPSQPPARGRRGRNVTRTEEKTAEESEQQDNVTPAEVLPVEVAPAEDLPTKVTEEAAVSAKPRRGGRKPKQETHSATQESSSEVQEVVVNATNKPKYSRRGKAAPEESEPAAESLEQEVAEEKDIKQPVSEAVKPSKRRGARPVNAKLPQVIDESPEQEVVEEKVIPQPVVETVKTTTRRGARSVKTEPPRVDDESPVQEVVEEEVINQPVVETVRTTKRRGAKSVKTEPQQVVHEIPVQEVVEEKDIEQPVVEKAKPSKRRGARSVKTEPQVETESPDPEVAEEKKIEEAVKKAKPTNRRGARSVKTEQQEVVAESPDQEVAEEKEIEQPVVETVKPRNRRGARSVKIEQQQVEAESPDQEVAEEKEVEQPVVEKAKPTKRRGARTVNTDTQVVHESLEQEVTEEKEISEPVIESIKPTKRRGACSVNVEAPQSVPAKRTRRGAAPQPEETSDNSSVQVPEEVPVEPPRRGRRAAPAKPQTDETPEVTNQAELPQDVSAVGKDPKRPKKCLRWNSEVQVCEIPKVTPVKAVRGRKTKLPEQINTEGQSTSKEASKAEEVQTEKPAEVPPTKRSRGAASVAKKVETTNEQKVADAATRPKTRSGRLAKK